MTQTSYITDAIVLPSTFEQLRTTSAGNSIRLLVDHLVANVTNPAIVNALLTLKWHFSSLEPDDRGLNETRANACEIVSWRFLSRLSERDAIEFCLYELPPTIKDAGHAAQAAVTEEESNDERTSLLPQFRARDASAYPTASPRSKRQKMIDSVTHIGTHLFSEGSIAEAEEDDPSSDFVGLSALEIAAVADAKKFLSQRLVQKIIYGIWIGEIVFWETLSVNTIKKPQFYSKKRGDPFSRLRVPKYIKAFEVGFFALGLALYYAVLVQRKTYNISLLEVLLYIWLTAFAYDELSEFLDAGLFYYTDFWSSWDMAIILDGLVFFIIRVIGLIQDDPKIVDFGFDILALEALFLVPRMVSLLSMHPYFGTLIPCLKEMTKDFIKFMAVVAILYAGFLTTFTLLARDNFTLSEMSWMLIKVFFGSSYIGFDNMHLVSACRRGCASRLTSQISNYLGPPLMLVFVTLSQILLVTALISILSNSFSKVSAHAREEYLFVYSVYVLEASTSNRLTHFYPPLNLLALIFRPLRLFVPAEHFRAFRIMLLKITHIPIVAMIMLYETLHDKLYGRHNSFSTIGPSETETSKLTGSFLTGKATLLRSPLYASEPSTPSPTKKLADVKRMGSRRTDSGDITTIDSNRSDGELHKKVDELSARIAELTALIMAQQNSGGSEE